MGHKLHIGCGNCILPGYTNIDEFNPKADVRASILDIVYPDGSVDIIEGYMVLEHLSFFELKKFLGIAYRMLIKGGRLIAEVPDLEKVSRLILAFADDAEYLEQGAFGLRGIFGEPKPGMTSGDFHKWGYTPSLARKYFNEAGFSHVTISDGISHGYPLRDMRIEAIK
jgi:Uncharacterized protein conserved in bacteria